MQSFFGQAEAADPVQTALANADVSSVAGPWQQIAHQSVAGLTAIGFDRAQDQMLVTTQTGQSVIEAATGDVIYRNHEQKRA